MNSRLFQNLILIFSFIFGLFFGVTIYAIKDYKGVEHLENFQPKIPSRLIDIKGELISEFFLQQRKLVPFSDFPAKLKQAFIAMEDNRFYDHFGIDIRGIIRAFFVNLLSGRIKEGGSTITQQLAKVVLAAREKTYIRKLKEAIVSIQIENNYSKNEIMTLYFNQIYLGHGAYGVEAASNFYFGKKVSEINLAESALLAALPSAPNLYSPLKNPHRSKERQKLCLIKMVENGFITIEEAEKSLIDFWSNYQDRLDSPSITVWGNRIDKAPYFTEYIRRILEPMLGKDNLYTGGLAIYTTLDLKAQSAAQQALEERLKIQRERSRSRVTPKEEIIKKEFSESWQLLSNFLSLPMIRSKVSMTQQGFSREFIKQSFDEIRLLNFISGSEGVSQLIEQFASENEAFAARDQVEGAIIALDYESGEIRAMVGGSSFRSDNQFNRTTQMFRQTGSSFKPIVYSTAMEEKTFTPASLVDDTPLLFLDEMGDLWTPENYSGEYLGPIRLRRALELSRNVISVKVAEKVGIVKVIEKAGLLIGLDEKETKKRFRYDLSIALGSLDISPLEMARAYAVFARGGTMVVPNSIRKILDRDQKQIFDGKKEVLAEIEKLKKENSYRIFSSGSSTLISSMLKSAATRGTGSAARSGYGKMVAGKTGSTNNFKDAWFVGFNHTLVAAIWFGFDKNGLTLGPGQSAGGISAPCFGRFMELAQGDLPDKGFGYFGGVVHSTICANSGLLPTELCPVKMDELFLPGTEPKELCKGCNGVEVFNKKFDRMDKLDKKDVLMDASKSDILPKLESKDSIFENQ